VIVDVPVHLNILYNFSKEVSTVVTSKLLHFPFFQTFRNFHIFWLGLYLRNYEANLWDWCHNLCFGRISWCSCHHSNIITLTSLEPNGHFSSEAQPEWGRRGHATPEKTC